MELSTCTLLHVNKKTDLMGIVESRYKWMPKPIHGLATLLHLAYKPPSLTTNLKLLATQDDSLPKVLELEDHMNFLKELINYNDQRGGLALASPITWREYMVKLLLWWESFEDGHPHVQRVAL